MLPLRAPAIEDKRKSDYDRPSQSVYADTMNRLIIPQPPAKCGDHPVIIRPCASLMSLRLTIFPRVPDGGSYTLSVHVEHFLHVRPPFPFGSVGIGCCLGFIMAHHSWVVGSAAIFRHVSLEVVANILKVGKEGIVFKEDRIIPDVALVDSLQNSRPNLRMVFNVLVVGFRLESDDLSIPLSFGACMISVAFDFQYSGMTSTVFPY